MHAVVLDSLEEYLSGALEPAAQRKLEAHLSGCGMCREEMNGMQEVSALFGSLRTDEVLSPTPGFYSRIMQQAGAQKAAPSFANLFALDLAFGRRLAFACLLTLAVLGGYLVSSEAEYSGPSPATVMAQQESPSFDSAPAPQNMLVTLTAYEH